MQLIKIQLSSMIWLDRQKVPLPRLSFEFQSYHWLWWGSHCPLPKGAAYKLAFLGLVAAAACANKQFQQGFDIVSPMRWQSSSNTDLSARARRKQIFGFVQSATPNSWMAGRMVAFKNSFECIPNPGRRSSLYPQAIPPPGRMLRRITTTQYIILGRNETLRNPPPEHGRVNFVGSHKNIIRQTSRTKQITKHMHGDEQEVKFPDATPTPGLQSWSRWY